MAGIRHPHSSRLEGSRLALFLDRKNQLITDEVLGHGTVDHAPVYPRELMRRALELSASALILVHNHPSGDPTPSSADVEITRQIVEAGRTLRIAVRPRPDARRKKILIVALARKLLIALWRFETRGVAPEGAVFKTA